MILASSISFGEIQTVYREVSPETPTLNEQATNPIDSFIKERLKRGATHGDLVDEKYLYLDYDSGHIFSELSKVYEF